MCCGLKKVVAKSRARVYFEKHIWALLLVFHQTYNLSRNKFARALTNQPISAPHFFNPQQMFLLRFKLITPSEKRETSTKTCNETMLRDKLRVFASRISPPLRQMATATALLGFNDLGRPVTPTFLFRNRFYLQLSTHYPKLNKISMWEVKKNSRFLSTEHGSCHLPAARRRETMVAKCELVL